MHKATEEKAIFLEFFKGMMLVEFCNGSGMGAWFPTDCRVLKGKKVVKKAA